MTSPWCTSRSKRAFDVTLTAVLLIPLAPVMAVGAVLVRLTLGRPIFFRQTRVGVDAEPFEFVKFRTMREQYDEHGVLLPEEDRVTGLGRWMRATSVDELPQLLHILQGRMSLVGPRPLIPRYVPRYSPRQARRHLVRPGLTGVAQVSGRNALTWEEKFELDVTYVETATFRTDLKILLITIKKVLRPEDGATHAIIWSPEFMGSPPEPTAEGAPSSH